MTLGSQALTIASIGIWCLVATVFGQQTPESNSSAPATASALVGTTSESHLVPKTFGQDTSKSDGSAAATSLNQGTLKFSNIVDPLEMLRQTIAANDVLLAKQRECLSQLAVLEAKAQAAKSAAHRSSEKK